MRPGTLFVHLATTSVAVAVAVAAAGPGWAGEIIFQAEPPPVPQTALLYRAAPTPLSRDMLVRRARDLGLPAGAAPTFVKTPLGVAVQWNASAAAVLPVTLFRDTSGAEMYATQAMLNEPPGVMAPIPDDVARRISTEWLRLHPGIIHEVELGPAPQVVHLIHQGQALDTGGMTPETQDESIVRFSRMLGGIPVIGPGDHAEVHVSNASEVTGLLSQWRRVAVTDQMLPVLPFATVREQFTAQMRESVANSAENALVTEIRFGYYSRPVGEEQNWYTPAYDFVVSFFSTSLNQTTGAEHIYLPAVDPALLREPLERPLPTPSPPDPARIAIQAAPPANVPQVVPLYTVSPTLVNTDTIRRRADQLGMSVANTQVTGRGLAALGADQKTVLAMDPGGSEFFGQMDRLMNATPGAVPPISDGAAIEAANAYLAGKAAFPRDQLGTPTVSHLFNQALDTRNGTTADPTQDEIIVVFPRLTAGIPGAGPGLPILGPNSGILVFVENTGEVVGHKALWRNLQPSQMTAQVMPYEQSLQVLQRKLLSQMGDGSVRVVRAQFGYYERPEGTAQGFLQPAYVFDCVFESADDPNGGTSGRTEVAVPASPTPEEPLDDEPMASPDSASDARTEIPTMYGDFNADGKVDTQDVFGVLHAVGGLGPDPVTPTQVVACDVSPGGFPGGDGALNLDDALRIMRSITGLDNITDGP